jgi:hypothetical protein
MEGGGGDVFAQSASGGQAGVEVTPVLPSPTFTQSKLGGQSLSVAQVWAEALPVMARPAIKAATDVRSFEVIVVVMGRAFLSAKGVTRKTKQNTCQAI